MPEAKFANLSIEDKAAQLIMIDIPDQELGEKSARHLSAHAWKGICKEACSVFELVGFKKGHIRKCDKSPCARVLT